MSTLAQVLKNSIENAKGNEYKMESIRKKVDVFYAADRITEDEYNCLIGLIEGRNDL